MVDYFYGMALLCLLESHRRAGDGKKKKKKKGCGAELPSGLYTSLGIYLYMYTLGDTIGHVAAFLIIFCKKKRLQHKYAHGHGSTQIIYYLCIDIF